MGRRKAKHEVGPRLGEPLIDRLHYCQLMLNMHGIATDAERARMFKRLKKLAAKNASKEPN